MRMRIATMLLVPALLAAGHDRASAQGLGGTTTSGAFGTRTLGTSLTAGGSQSGAATSSPLGGVGANGTSALTDAAASVGGVSGNERFVRGTQPAGTFIGGATGAAGDFIGGNAGVNSLNSINSFLQGLGGNRQNQNANNGGRGGGQDSRQIPAKLVVGFTPPVRRPSTVSATIASRITRLPGIKTNGPIEVALEGRTAVLRGVVASDHDRDLLERVILLEVGISKVENELTVATPDPSPPESESP